jgi:hypothetical protein
MSQGEHDMNSFAISCSLENFGSCVHGPSWNAANHEAYKDALLLA